MYIYIKTKKRAFMMKIRWGGPCTINYSCGATPPSSLSPWLRLPKGPNEVAPNKINIYIYIDSWAPPG